MAGIVDPYYQVLQSLTIYDPLPSTDGLSALSQTGVTNTAPTEIDIVQWVDVTAGSSGEFTGSNGTYSTGAVGWMIDHGQYLVQFKIVDPEGNPGVYSIISDATGGKIIFAENQFDNVSLNAIHDPGSYALVMRATDPGGLFVEQTFTLTVTA